MSDDQTSCAWLALSRPIILLLLLLGTDYTAASVNYEQQLLAPDRRKDDLLGLAIALQGDTALITTSPDHGTLSPAAPGYGYLFDLGTGQSVGRLESPGMPLKTNFGASTAMDGSWAVIGGYKIDDPSGAERVGAVKVFDLGTGQEQYTLRPPVAETGQSFGIALAMEGDKVLVGAPGKINTDTGLNAAGAVYLYQIGQPDPILSVIDPRPSGDDVGGFFGRSVAMSAGKALIGAPRYTSVIPGSPKHGGAAYLLDLDTGATTAIDPPNLTNLDQAGWGVALNERWGVVTAVAGHDTVPGSGVAYVIDPDTGDIIHMLAPDNPTTDMQFGYSVAIDGDLIVIGARFAKNHGVEAAGMAYVFHAASGKQLARYALDDPQYGDMFGSAVAIEGQTIVVSAIARSVDELYAGAAYVYTIPEPSTVFMCLVPMALLTRLHARNNY